uniref:Uncharacterized protein n=1 Tax=Picea sitchensis TaxID=3332 RepID=A9NQ29_PICSI|nr:unknown [Picea sitchensis]
MPSWRDICPRYGLWRRRPKGRRRTGKSTLSNYFSRVK